MKSTVSLVAVLIATLLSPVLQGQGIVDVRPHRLPAPRDVAGIEIRAHRVAVTLADTAARTVVEQTFHNPNGFEAEGVYLFPVPAGASVTNFAMSMNGKMVEGEVLERDQARRIYEDIVRRRRDPGLLEYADRRLFRARVFPIPPRGEVQVRIAYVEVLDGAGGLIEYRYPLRTQAFSERPVADVAVDVDIEASSQVTTVFSSSHAIQVTRDRDRHRAALSAADVVVDRDFTLYVGLSDRAFGLGALTTRPRPDEDGYFMLTIAPARGFDDVRVLPRDMVFVVDTSGSMKNDDKIAEARNALLHGVGGLRPEDRFDVVAFATEVRTFAEGLVPASPERIAAAEGFVRDLEARGGTNIGAALERAMARFADSKDRLRIVVFVTDGLPTVGETRPDAIAKAVATINPDAATRLFVFGVGYDVNADLLDRLAEENAGARDYVTPSQNLEMALSGFFDKVSSPVLSDVALDVAGVAVSHLHPKRIPDVFKGQEITVFGRYRGEGEATIRLTGHVNGDPRVLSFRSTFAGAHQGRDFIETLWARREIGYLLDQIRAHGKEDELKAEVVELARRYGIATPYTSMLVLEDDAHVADARQGDRDGFGRFSLDAPPAPEAGRAGGGGWRPRGEGPGGSGYTGSTANPVESSLARKKLREADVEAVLEEAETADADRPADARLRRVGARAFVRKDEIWVETTLVRADDAARAEPDETVEAFSPRYFELLKEHAELAGLLARMPELELRLGDRVIRFRAAKAEAPATGAPAEGTSEPSVEPPPAPPAKKDPEPRSPAEEAGSRKI